MKLDVTDIDSGSQRHAERLNGAIQVLVIKRIFIVPHAGTQVGYFVTHEENAVASRRWSWSRLDLVYRRTCPSHDGRLLSMGVADRRKAESRRPTANTVLLVRGVVIHVALVRMTLAPGAFVRDDIFRFGKIGRARILRRDQVTGLHQNAVRSYVMTVAGVVVGC
jgi:hypothetical protein